ncbi:MAG: phosphomannomutase/phosphoglucomutase [Patescibacteria group bacterium]
MKEFPHNIFKKYDIRGIYPKELDETMIYKIGRAYATFLWSKNPQAKKLKVIVGKDMRLSTPALEKKLVEALTEGGLDVTRIGLASTPTFYFAVAFYGFDGGLQVSASHNPKEYNGVKMVRQKAIPISEETGITEIKNIVLSGEFLDKDNQGEIAEMDNVIEAAVKEELKGIDYSEIKPFRIVVDAANAMGALDIEAIFSSLPCELIKMNFELDGTFPVHQPDPLDEDNLQILKEAVKKEKADLGIAPDGDGDRYFFVDDKGEAVRQEILRGIMAQIELAENPGATVVYDIRPGRITRDLIEEAGGRPIVAPVGHSLIKEVMIKENAIFGGESSGHYFYKFPYGTFESPIVLVVKLLRYLSQRHQPFSQVIKPYQRYFHSGEINSEVADVKGKIEELKKYYADGEQNYIDGVTVTYDDWWFNLRGSNTEPKIRLNLEARSKELMEEKRDEVLKMIRK